MEGETAEHIALKCVNALELLPESTPSIKHLVDGKVYGCLLTVLALCWTKSEHFAGPNLVSCVRQPSGTDKVDCASIVHHNINRYKA
ncbi:uncharacterized protein [Panulirus ornatus]|uniref:uncharacterized protein isoform X2 n=1 Tax=Panulirus ornatus TaxID=150431 RepID=UPI003A88199F